MKSSLINKILILSFDGLIIALCAFGVWLLICKSDLPVKDYETNSFIALSGRDNLSGLSVDGDTILTINSVPVRTLEEQEMLLDGLKIGQPVTLKTSNKRETKTYQLKLTGYYSKFYLITTSLTGYFFILIGIFVLLKCYNRKEAKIYHAVSVATGAIILLSPGNYSMPPIALNLLVNFLFGVAYTFVPVAFIHFTLSFPFDRISKNRRLIVISCGLAFILSILISLAFFKMVMNPSAQSIKNYISYFDVGRSLMIAAVLGGIIIFALSYKMAVNPADRKRLKWLLVGFVIGPLPYIVLWVIPQALTGSALIPEELVIVLMSAVPITFAISIVKYHLLDIDLIINRSFVYAIVLGLLIAIYISAVSLIALFVHAENRLIPSISAAVIIALLLNPVRNMVQHFVDKKFFKVQYDFRLAMKEFLVKIKEANTIDLLANKIMVGIDNLIPVEKIGFFLLIPVSERVKLVAHKNFDLLHNRSVKFEFSKLKSNLALPVAVQGKVEKGVLNEIADRAVFERWGMEIVFPVKSLETNIFAFIVLGAKKSGMKFTAEDVDLLSTIASNAAITMERINLQSELIRKQHETERLEELNKMKSMFVSRVSHDLKTPLTSIKIFTEILQNDDINKAQNLEYLNIIEGETNRLTRLIDNVLEVSRIENGIRGYNFKKINIHNLIRKVVKVMEYELNMQRCKLNLLLCKNDIIINADGDAVMEALINLITNSLKYSHARKIITISTFVADEYFKIIVQDEGIGISEKDLTNIFKPFFRSKNNQKTKIAGTGLGLSIVKHILDAHKGSVGVESMLNCGSKFTLNFPLKIN